MSSIVVFESEGADAQIFSLGQILNQTASDLALPVLKLAKN